MVLSLPPLLLALASAAPQDELRICDADFGDGGRSGHVALLVGGDYRPSSLTLSLREPDGWSRAEIALDPAERRLPGLLSNAFVALRFTRPPELPLRMNAYADGRLRWRHEIRTPFWPGSLDRSATVTRIGRHAPGTVDSLGRADDGVPVPAPHELAIFLVDARDRQVGETRYILPGAAPDGPAAAALAAVEAQYRARTCHEGAPPID
jgi:hypothetical protein